MGGEGFMEKLKMLLMGSGGATPPQEPIDEAAPWNTPIGPPPMPRRPMPSPSPSPMMPEAGGDDIGMQVQQLMKQRELAKRLAPEGMWNK